MTGEGTSPVRAAAHLFVDDLENPSVRDDDRHHLERVLRIRPGETVSVSDGQGGLRICTFAPGGSLEPAGDVDRQPARSPAIGVGFALVKNERPEWIVQKLTECGVDRILPFLAERSVVRWDASKAERNLERLRTVALGAAMQSRQRWLPTVEPVSRFDAVCSTAGPAVARADFDGHPPDLSTPVVLVGPEGGWAPEERAAVPRAVSLGPAVLRAETAALAVGVLLTAFRSGVAGPSNLAVRGQDRK